MIDDSKERQIASKSEDLVILVKRYQAACAQRLRTLNDAEKIILDEQIKQFDEAIQQLESEIQDLKTSIQPKHITYRQVTRQWEDRLHKIDFSKVESTLVPVFKTLKHSEGSALFLLKSSYSMGGKWCVQKIKNKIYEEIGTFLLSHEIGFPSFQKLSSLGLLQKLAERFSVPLDTPIDQNSYRNLIIDRIIQSLAIGNILLLEINIYSLDHNDQFVEWFVNDFWIVLVRKLQQVYQGKSRIRLIAILAIVDSVPRTYLPASIMGKKKNYDGLKVLDLPLQKWSESDIYNWLFDFSGLTSSPTRLTDDQIAEMASRIHRVTAGQPCNVYHQLMEVLTECAC